MAEGALPDANQALWRAPSARFRRLMSFPDIDSQGMNLDLRDSTLDEALSKLSTGLVTVTLSPQTGDRSMRVLVLGSGAREHALCAAVASSPACEALFCAPGNPGISEEAICLHITPADLEGKTDAVLTVCRRERIDFVIVGPEAPLVAGLVDRLEAGGIAAFGPTAAAAALEGSKAFTKDLCTRHGIPTAPYRRFSDVEAAKDYVRERGTPIVIKADGLAAGKGVTVANTLGEAFAAIDGAMVSRHFGAAGSELVIEDFLAGEEVSYFALIDGKCALSFGSAQDHKRVGDGDVGPNTGGMGAYSPAHCLTPALEIAVMERIIRPTAAAMVAEGRPYKGILYAGLMLTTEGPQLIEYNVRFGDPECQVILPRLKTDLLSLLVAARSGRLDAVELSLDKGLSAICVVLAANGYPGEPLRGTQIHGLADAAGRPGVKILHAGTTKSGDKIIANGGRVLSIVATATNLKMARDRAYEVVDRIQWSGGFCRRDIGWRALESMPPDGTFPTKAF